MRSRLTAETISGFVEEGRIKKMTLVDGGWVDDIRMGILKEEYWEKRSS
jgi:RimJ/RimL family protein N-acetyltransferase